MTRDARAVEALLAGAAEWRLLSLLFSRPRHGWAEEVTAVAREVRDRELRAAAAEAEAATEGAYHALLGPGGPASPREAAHLGFADPGRALSDLAARYGAFGYAPLGEEPDDHLAVECDFVAYLFLKESYALAAGQGERAEVTGAERARFVAEHAAVVGRRFASKLPVGAPPYLRTAGAALAARLPEVPPAPEGPSEEDCLGCPGLSAR